MCFPTNIIYFIYSTSTMNAKLFILFACVLIVCQGAPAPASTSCTASITASPRAGSSWTEGGVSFQLYDITATNTGGCPITSLFGLFGFPSTGIYYDSHCSALSLCTIENAVRPICALVLCMLCRAQCASCNNFGLLPSNVA